MCIGASWRKAGKQKENVSFIKQTSQSAHWIENGENIQFRMVINVPGTRTKGRSLIVFQF